MFQTRQTERLMREAARCGLYLGGSAEFLKRADSRQPFLTVFEFGRSPSGTPHQARCVVRDARGEITPDYLLVRAELGLPA